MSMESRSCTASVQVFGVQVRVARLHNVFGPWCAWRGGREKAPQGICRSHAWWQSRSGSVGRRRAGAFVLVHRRLLALSRCPSSPKLVPINLGSDVAVSVNQLVKIADDVVKEVLCLSSSSSSSSPLSIRHVNGPVGGVRWRNADPTLAAKLIEFTARTRLEDGMLRTARWIYDQMQSFIQSGVPLSSLSAGETASCGLASEDFGSKSTFGILLPIMSRGASERESKQRIVSFVHSLHATTDGDALREGCWVLLGLDDDDPLCGISNPASQRSWLLNCFFAFGFRVHVVSMQQYPRGQIVRYWSVLAQESVHHLGCRYFVLLGDDIILHTRFWMSRVDAEFRSIQGPDMFGCVCIFDRCFPGFPTFPVLGARHLEIFPDVFPSRFTNQDADPFVFELYRPWRASRILLDVELSNTVGGAHDARYSKSHAVDWSLRELPQARRVVREWFASDRHKGEQRRSPISELCSFSTCWSLAIVATRPS